MPSTPSLVHGSKPKKNEAVAAIETIRPRHLCAFRVLEHTASAKQLASIDLDLTPSPGWRRHGAWR